MKPKLILAILAAIGGIAALSLLTPITGCTTTTVGTNVVVVIDQQKLADVQAALDPVLSSVLRRVIKNSPQHSVEIAGYARAVGRAFLQIKTSHTFSPADVINVVNNLTSGLQAGVPDEIIDAKNAAIAIYKILWNDKLTTTVPLDGWMDAVSNTFINVINQALIDAGQPGVVR